MLPQLQVYHATVSFMAAAGAVMMMQVVGAELTALRHTQRFQRVVLGLMAIALFCSGLRMPEMGAYNPLVLLSAAAVNTGICLVLLPPAVMGYSEERP
jgi:hypothetical protein